MWVQVLVPVVQPGLESQFGHSREHRRAQIVVICAVALSVESTLSSLQQLAQQDPAMKSTKGAVSTANFLFVDYQKDDPRDAAMHKEKLLFTQRNYQRKKKLAAVERLKASSKISRQSLPFKYTSTSTENRDEVETHKDTSNLTVPDPDQPRQTWQIARMAELWSPKAYLGQGFVDPFSTAAVPMTETMNSYFHHRTSTPVSLDFP